MKRPRIYSNSSNSFVKVFSTDLYQSKEKQKSNEATSDPKGGMFQHKLKNFKFE